MRSRRGVASRSPSSRSTSLPSLPCRRARSGFPTSAPVATSSSSTRGRRSGTAADRGRARGAVPGEPPRPLPAHRTCSASSSSRRRRRGSSSSPPTRTAREARPRLRRPRVDARHGTARFKTYDRTKLMNMLFARELARRLDGTGVTANSAASRLRRDQASHATATSRVHGQHRHAARPAVRELPREGRTTSMFVASAPELEGVTGQYFAKSRLALSPRGDGAATTPAAARLWAAESNARRHHACARRYSVHAHPRDVGERHDDPRPSAVLVSTTWSAPTTSAPSTPSCSSAVPNVTLRVAFVRDERAAGTGRRGVRAAMATLRRVRRDFEAERDRRRQVHVDPTGRAAQREQVGTDLLDGAHDAVTADRDGDLVTTVHVRAQAVFQRLPVRPVLGRVARRRVLFGSPRGAHRRARVAEVRMLRESVGFVHAASAAAVSNPNGVRRARGARRPRGGSGSSSARGPCRSAGSPRRRTA